MDREFLASHGKCKRSKNTWVCDFGKSNPNIKAKTIYIPGCQDVSAKIGTVVQIKGHGKFNVIVKNQKITFKATESYPCE